MQHIIIDKSDNTKIILNDFGIPQINASRKELTDKEAYFNFDSKKHIHARGPKPLPEHWILEGAVIREKTLAEKVNDDIITVDKGFILDGDEIRSMTDAEKLTAGLITQIEHDEIIKTNLINAKVSELMQTEYDLKLDEAIEALTVAGVLTATGELKK